MFVVTRRAVKLFINIDQSAPLAWVPLCLRDTTGFSRVEIQFQPNPVPHRTRHDTTGFSRVEIQFPPGRISRQPCFGMRRRGRSWITTRL